MARAGWLAVVGVVSLVPGPAGAQFGGIGGGGFGGAMAPTKAVTVEVEVSSGKRLSGPIALEAVTIDCDFGRYQIRPEKVRAIRFDAEAPREPGVNGLMHVPGTVVATSGEEIGGTLLIPSGWTIGTDLGTVTLDPTKLRSITFLSGGDGDGGGGDPTARGGAEPGPGAGAAGVARGNPSRVVQIGSYFWAVSPRGDRVAVRDPASGATQTVELPASAEAPLRVTPVVGARLAALQVEGPSVSRIAAYSFSDRTWHALELQSPVEGRASPVVGAAVAAYGLGRHVYAFSAEANGWDVLELPEGTSAAPVVSNDSVTVTLPDQIHTFSAATGRWAHTALDDLLDAPAAPTP